MCRAGRLEVVARALVAALTALALALACGGGGGGGGGGTPPQSFEHFMGASGGSFTDGFTFVGENLDPWRFMAYHGEAYSLDEIRDWVSKAVSATGAKVMRMHVNGGAFEPTVGSYDEAAFRQLDDLVVSLIATAVQEDHGGLRPSPCFRGPHPPLFASHGRPFRGAAQSHVPPAGSGSGPTSFASA